MLRLSLLGGLSLAGDGQAVGPAAAQPRRLALLAVLAAAGERGVSRDRLMLLFWPESNTESARNALKQAVFALRRDIGTADLVTGATELRLIRSHLTCDLWDFEAALSAGDDEAAASAYGGPFLDGVHIDQADEFEQWADVKRAQFARKHAEALARLADGALVAGRASSAAAWWRLVVERDPLDPRATIGLMRALVAAGNGLGALTAYATHETAMRRALDLPVASDARAFAERIRRDLESAYTPPRTEAPNTAGRSVADLPAPATEFTRSGRPGALRRYAVSAAAVLAAAAATLTLLGHRPARSAEGSTVLVFPFEREGEPDSGLLRYGLPRLIAADLDGAGNLHALDPLPSSPPPLAGDAGGTARALGADLYVTGNVVSARGKIHVVAQLFASDRPDSPLGEADADGLASDPFGVADDVSRALLGDYGEAGTSAMGSAAALSTRSVAALKVFLRGDEALRAGDYEAAVAGLAEATRLDPGFALAWYRLAIASDWVGHSTEPTLQTALARASALAGHLGPHYRMLLEGYQAWWRGDADRAESLYTLVLHKHPDDLDAWVQLGEVRFHLNPLRGRDAEEARDPFERALALQPGDLGALKHLAELAARRHQLGDLEALADRYMARARADTIELRTIEAFDGNNATDQQTAVASLSRGRASSIAEIAERVYLFADSPEGAREIVALLAEPRWFPERRAWAEALEAQILVGEGRWRDARLHLAEATQLDPVRGRALTAYLLALPVMPGHSAEEAAALDSLERVPATKLPTMLWGPPDMRPYYVAYALGLGAASTDDSASAARYVDKLASLPGVGDLAAFRDVLIRRIHALWLLRTGYPAAALDTLSVKMPLPLGWYLTEISSNGLEAFLRADALERLGRREEALKWYAASALSSEYDAAFIGQSELRQARILDALGSTALAREHYRRFVELWSGCDAEFSPMLNFARERLAKLGG